MTSDRPLRVLCAPDSFKESLSAADVARAMARGARAAGAEADVCPIADGGEGTLDALATALGGDVESVDVVGPFGEPRQARLGLCRLDDRPLDNARAEARRDIGIVELAEAAGLTLVPPTERDPTRTTTYGVGLMILIALGWRYDRIVVAVGGSATCDGGAGIVQALGARFYDRAGQLIEAPMTGERLLDIAWIDPPHALVETPVDPFQGQIRVACDVTNPLFGPEGAAFVYGPQKGATTEQVERLDAGLRHFAALVGGDPEAPGAGAAGGAAFGLAALCGAKLERGVELVLDAVGFEGRCRTADLVLTGEGRLDAQTLNGKAVAGVADLARQLGVPTVAIVGSTGPGASDCTDPARGGPLRSFMSLAERFGETRARREPAPLIAAMAEEVVAQELARIRGA